MILYKATIIFKQDLNRGATLVKLLTNNYFHSLECGDSSLI